MNLDKFTWYGHWIGIFFAFVSWCLLGILKWISCIFVFIFLTFSIICFLIGNKLNKKEVGDERKN